MGDVVKLVTREERMRERAAALFLRTLAERPNMSPSARRKFDRLMEDLSDRAAATAALASIETDGSVTLDDLKIG